MTLRAHDLTRPADPDVRTWVGVDLVGGPGKVGGACTDSRHTVSPPHLAKIVTTPTSPPSTSLHDHLIGIAPGILLLSSSLYPDPTAPTPRVPTPNPQPQLTQPFLLIVRRALAGGGPEPHHGTGVGRVTGGPYSSVPDRCGPRGVWRPLPCPDHGPVRCPAVDRAVRTGLGWGWGYG